MTAEQMRASLTTSEIQPDCAATPKRASRQWIDVPQTVRPSSIKMDPDVISSAHGPIFEPSIKNPEFAAIWTQQSIITPLQRPWSLHHGHRACIDQTIVTIYSHYCGKNHSISAVSHLSISTTTERDYMMIDRILQGLNPH